MVEQAQTRRRFATALIGLTGGIGCGKSTTAALFCEAGFRVIDTDAIVRTQVLTSPEVLAEARARWGAGVLTAAGQLDRARVAEIVFAQPPEKAWWESVVHPRVGRIWRGQVAAEPEAEWVVEIPLLYEARLEKGFDFVVCVGANRRTQVLRVVARGLTTDQAEQRIASQIPLETKLNLADAVVWNEGSRDFLRRQVFELAGRVRRERAARAETAAARA